MKLSAKDRAWLKLHTEPLFAVEWEDAEWREHQEWRATREQAEQLKTTIATADSNAEIYISKVYDSLTQERLSLRDAGFLA